MLRCLVSLLVLALISCFTPAESASDVDPALPDYRPPATPLAGKVISVGSDALNNLMTFWAEGFQAAHPPVSIQIQEKGGSTAGAALLSGVAQIGTTARPLSEDEIEAITRQWGYPPTRILVAFDAVCVFVHKDNPVPSLTLAQVDAAFSTTRTRGGNIVATWGDLGLHGEWAAQQLTLLGRNHASGTYGFFKQRVLERGEFKPTLREQAGSRMLVESVAADRGGIGFTGLGSAAPGVRAVPLADLDGIAIEASADQVRAGRYPLQRSFFLYVNRPPGGAPLIDAFLAFVLSRQGQEVVAKDGYLPLTADMAAEQQRSLK